MENVKKSMENNYKVICPECIGSVNPKRFCGIQEHCGHCTRCTHFYPKPQSFKDWLTYYFRRVKNYCYWVEYKIKNWWGWIRYEYLTNNHIPSDLKKGDVILWRDKQGDLHKDMVQHIWVEYEWRQNRFLVMASLSHSGRSALSTLLGNAEIIAINGKCPRGFNCDEGRMEGKDNYKGFFWEQYRYEYEKGIKPYLDRDYKYGKN